MAAPEDIVLITSCCSFLLSALIIDLLLMVAYRCKKGHHVVELQNPSLLYLSDEVKCNLYWAAATSTISIVLCLLCGFYLIYCLILYYDKHDDSSIETKIVEALTGHSPTAINIVSRFFQMIVIFLFLLHPMRKLRKRYGKWNRLIYMVLGAIVCAFLSFISVFLDTWYYLVNMISYLFALVVIVNITRLFYNDILIRNANNNNNNSNNNNNNDNHNNGGNYGLRESQAMLSKPTVRAIDNLSKQVVLLIWQCCGMALDFILQTVLFGYHLVRQIHNHHEHDAIYYISLATQILSLCILIILVNVCIWLSFEFAQTGYEKCVCYSCCHNGIQKTFADTKMRGDNLKFSDPIHDIDESYNSIGGDAQTMEESDIRIPIDINKIYQTIDEN